MKIAFVSIIMGSSSDRPVMEHAAEVLRDFDVPYEMTVVSAHRTPDRMFEFARTARERGVKIIIAGAGGAAHLPGMVASITELPVIGVPIKSSNSLDGWDSLLSIVQMPGGVPVATVAVDGGKNAGVLAVKMLGIHDTVLLDRVRKFMTKQRDHVLETAREMEQSRL